MVTRINWNTGAAILTVFLTLGCGGSSSDSSYSNSTDTSASDSGYGYSSSSNTTTAITDYSSSNQTTDDSAAQVVFNASHTWQLNAHPAQQVPRVDDQQTVVISMQLDETNSLVKGSFSNSDIAGYSMAHLHKGEIGQNGAVLLNFVDDGYGTSSIDVTSIDAETLTMVKNGETHINIHTQMYPAGKFRAQIADDQTTLMLFTLDGSQEVPATNTTATGDGYASYHEQNGLTVRISVGDLTNITGVHIHEGSAGENGDVIAALIKDPDNSSGWKTDGALMLDQDTVTTLLNGGHYINVHTSDFPSGEIRGQLNNSYN